MPFASKIAFAFLSIPIAVFALDSEFDVHYRLGISDFSSLSHTPGISFAVYPWKNFGFASGLDYSMRKKTNAGEGVELSKTIIDDDGDEITIKHSIGKYREELQANTFQIPVLLKFRWDYFYIAGGVKIGLPQDMNAKFRYDSLETKGCVYGVCIDDLSYMGFGRKDSSATTKITLKTLYMLTAESGVRIKFTENLALVLGAYADYSLNHGFKRDLPGVKWVELTEESAEIELSDNWKSWKPWSVGGDARLSYSTSSTMVTAGITILIFDLLVAFMMKYG